MPHLLLAWTQLKMFWRQRTFTAHHPPFHTWMIDQIIFRLPVIGGVSFLACYNLLLVYSLIYTVYRRYYDVAIVAMPLVLTDLIILAGPVVDVRYTFPIIFCMPVMIAYIVYRSKLGACIRENVIESE